MKPTIAIDNEYIERWKKKAEKWSEQSAAISLKSFMLRECCLSGSEELSVPMTGKENYG